MVQTVTFVGNQYFQFPHKFPDISKTKSLGVKCTYNRICVVGDKGGQINVDDVLFKTTYNSFFGTDIIILSF